VRVVSFSDCEVDPDYVEEVASDLGSVPRFSKRKVSPLAFLLTLPYAFKRGHNDPKALRPHKGIRPDGGKRRKVETNNLRVLRHSAAQQNENAAEYVLTTDLPERTRRKKRASSLPKVQHSAGVSHVAVSHSLVAEASTLSYSTLTLRHDPRPILEEPLSRRRKGPKIRRTLLESRGHPHPVRSRPPRLISYNLRQILLGVKPLSNWIASWPISEPGAILRPPLRSTTSQRRLLKTKTIFMIAH
jgi:hypothetical protein